MTDQTPPRRRRRWPLFVAIGGVLVLFAVCVAAIAGSGGSQQSAKPAATTRTPTRTATPTPTATATPTRAPTPVPVLAGMVASAVVNPMAGGDWMCTNGPPQWECRYRNEPAAYYLRLEGPDDNHLRRVEGYVNATRTMEQFRKDAALARLQALAQRLSYDGYDKGQALGWLSGQGGGGTTVMAGARWTVTAAPPVWRLEVVPA